MYMLQTAVTAARPKARAAKHASLCLTLLATDMLKIAG
jgi:hypothetical protein